MNPEIVQNTFDKNINHTNKITKPILIGGGAILLFIGVVFGYLLHIASDNKIKPLSVVNVAAPTVQISSEQSRSTTTKQENAPTVIPIMHGLPPHGVSPMERDSIKLQVEKSTQLQIEALDISTSGDDEVAFIGHPESWEKYGVYLYNRTSNTLKPVYEELHSISGRGGAFGDSVTVKYSPNGTAFFANKSGINFPSFVVATKEGIVLLKSNDIGSATWISDRNLLYMAVGGKTNIFHTTDKTISQTALPNNLFYMEANETSSKIIAFISNYDATREFSECSSSDLVIYSFPEGKLLKKVTGVNATYTMWKNDKSITYKKITSCKKIEAETMGPPYIPVSEERTESF